MEEVEFGRYRLIRLLGRGGMGEVWRAFDNQTQRVVALKVLPPHVADDPQFTRRFRREAFAAAALANPHIVPIHDFGEIDGRLYVDMRLIEGSDLNQLIAKGPMTVDRCVSIIEQVASALQSAHKVGLIHRDVKPSNILVDEEDFVYLIDFGIARTIGQTSMTGTSTVIGTWAYMAPERFSKEQIDARADVYALACVFFECLTGRQPFPASSLERQIAAHISEPPPNPSKLQPTVPAAIDAVMTKGMAKDPNERFRTAKDLAAAARDAATTNPASASAKANPPCEAPKRPSPAKSPSGGHAAPAAMRQKTGKPAVKKSSPPGKRSPTSVRKQISPVPTPTPPIDPNREDPRWVALAVLGAVIFLCVIALVVWWVLPDSDSSDPPALAPRSEVPPAKIAVPFTVAFGPRLRLDVPSAPESNADAMAFPINFAALSS